MNGKKAKALRRFAARMGAIEGLEAVKYNVIQHVRVYYVPPVTKAEKYDCWVAGTKSIKRSGETFQIAMDRCVRQLYQFTKKKYMRQSW